MLYDASKLPALADFSAQRGDSWEQSIYLITNTEGVAANFDFPSLPNAVKIDTKGIQAKMDIRKGGRYVRRITNNGIGGILTDTGHIKLTLSAEQTQALKPDKYQYELRLTLPNGGVVTYLKGFFRIVVDQDQLIEKVLIVGNLDSALLLSTSQNFLPTTQNTTPDNPTSGEVTTHALFKAPNGNYFIHRVDNNGAMRTRRVNPKDYPSAVVFIQPIDQ